METIGTILKPSTSLLGPLDPWGSLLLEPSSKPLSWACPQTCSVCRRCLGGTGAPIHGAPFVLV